MVHSSTDSNFLQEVEELEKQKKEAKDDDQRREVEQKLQIKELERDLANARMVRQTAKQLTYKNYHSSESLWHKTES